jgi:hypothetical protein
MRFLETIAQRFRPALVSWCFRSAVPAKPHEMGAGAIAAAGIERLSTERRTRPRGQA